MNKIYNNGENIIIHNPTPQMIPFLRLVDPSYETVSFRPRQGFIPRFQQCRVVLTEISDKDIYELSLSELKEIHLSAHELNSKLTSSNSVSRLSLKKEIVFKQMTECQLCALKCKANRFVEKGKCGLDFKAYLAELFTHIGEEEVINKAIVANFGGCSWGCVYCINHEFKHPETLPVLDVQSFWDQVNKLLDQDGPINTLEFAGGNPTESLAWILELLSKAPDDFNLPIVWNSNLYTTKESIELLDGVVDIYLADFRYGNNVCAKRLSEIGGFWETATKVADAMISQKSRVIFRILVLPNHIECCHRMVLEWLSQFKDKVWISILDQYVPEYNAYLYRDINRRPSKFEIKEVEDLVHHYGLRDIKSANSEFWND